MVLTIPESLKSVTAYIRRAEELEKDTSSSDYKIVAYFCKKYAVEAVVKLKVSSPEVNTFLSTLLSSLEKDKPGLGVNNEQALLIIESFANSVFSRADDEDRRGQSTKITAKVFYSAATFFEILEQFGELSPDVRVTKAMCLLLMFVIDQR